MEKHEIKIPSGCEVDSITTEGGSVVVTFKITQPQLPETWEEFCCKNPVKQGECIIENGSQIDDYIVIQARSAEFDRNLLPDRATAEAVLALCQLIQLRDCYNQGWQPNWNDDDENKYMIVLKGGEPFKMAPFYSLAYSPLYFKTEELRDLFLENFIDLIEKTKPLYGIKKGGEE